MAVARFGQSQRLVHLGLKVVLHPNTAAGHRFRWWFIPRPGTVGIDNSIVWNALPSNVGF